MVLGSKGISNLRCLYMGSSVPFPHFEWYLYVHVMLEQCLFKLPWNPKQPFFEWMFGDTSIFYIKTWFIIQLKEP